MNKQRGYTIVELLLLLLLIGGAFGWGWNIVKIFQVIDDPLTAMIVFRGIGIFVPPLGAILGYL